MRVTDSDEGVLVGHTAVVTHFDGIDDKVEVAELSLLLL